MSEASLSGKRMTGKNGAIPDNGTLRQDLLPASIAATARAGEPTALDDLVLREPALVAGRVRFTDGTPVARAELFLGPRGTRTLKLNEHVGLTVGDDGRLAAATGIHTDADGGFSLASQPGTTVVVGVLRIEGFVTWGDLVLRATAPEQVQMTVPLPITLRPRRNGQPCPDAQVELPNELRARSADGQLRVILFEPSMSLRVRSGGARSRAIELQRGQAGSTVDVDLDQPLAPVAIEFRGDGKVRQAVFEFTPLPAGESWREYLQRDDRGEPFRMLVTPGRYRLTVRAAPGEHGSTFLRAQSLDIDVGTAGGAWTLPMSFGGRISVAATDRDGRFVGGRCTVRDRDGRDRTSRCVVRDGNSADIGAAGELLLTGVNELADLLDPGDYDVELDLGAHGIERRRVTVRAGEVTEVAIRVR
jgi:hypothetical protein